MTKIKIVLQSDDGLSNHGQGIIAVDMTDDTSIANHRLVRWNGKLYCFMKSGLEQLQPVAFFNECGEPYDITEF